MRLDQDDREIVTILAGRAAAIIVTALGLAVTAGIAWRLFTLVGGF